MQVELLRYIQSQRIVYKDYTRKQRLKILIDCRVTLGNNWTIKKIMSVWESKKIVDYIVMKTSVRGVTL